MFFWTLRVINFEFHSLLGTTWRFCSSLMKLFQFTNSPIYSCVLSDLSFDWKLEAGLELRFLIQIDLCSLLCSCKQYDLYVKRSDVYVKTKSTRAPTPLPIKSEVTEYTTVKWIIDHNSIQRLGDFIKNSKRQPLDIDINLL